MRNCVAILIFALPIYGMVSSPFGMRSDPYTRSPAFHSGVDISGKYALAVKSMKSGAVAFAGKRSGYGKLVIVSHGDGFETYYAHLGRIFVNVGENVVAGQALGWMGMTGRATGPHVHFELRRHGKPLPVDGGLLN